MTVKPPASPTGDMTPEEFREYGHRVIDWIAEYLAHPERHPVLARVAPGEVRGRLPDQPPERPEPMDRILADLDEIIMPGMTHWNHPGFFAYFAISGSGPGILGELLSAAFNVNAMLWKTCPSATELEECVLDWLRQLVGLPGDFAGQIVDTASMASLCAVTAARETAIGPSGREQGLAGRDDLPRLRLYTSEEAHSSIEKAALVLGVGRRGVRKIRADDRLRLDVQALAHAIQEDRKAGWLPFCVVATVGTTSTASIDPVPGIAELCRFHDLWLHVDAAYGGAAAILPEMRDVLAGCEHADSVVINPHKWLFTPIDLSAFYCRRPEDLRRVFSMVPEYLRTGEGESVHNLMEYGVALGRRFRALKLWMVLRYFGGEGLRARLRRHIELAARFAGWIETDPGFELAAPQAMSLICFRARLPAGTGEGERSVAGTAGPDPEGDRFQERLLEVVNAGGEVYLSHTRVHGRLALRLAIGNIRSTEEHVGRAWELLRSGREQLLLER